jgi:hypothetical protein
MEAKPGIDRRKHESDILEHVMKGIRTQAPERGRAPQIVDLGIRGWGAGTVTSAVQVQVVDDEPERR